MITNQDFNQLVSLLAIVLVVDAGLVMGKVSSPKVEISLPMKSAERTDLLERFAEFNPEAQRGAIHYIEKMRKRYQKA